MYYSKVFILWCVSLKDFPRCLKSSLSLSIRLWIRSLTSYMNCLVSKVSSTNQFLYWHKKTPEIQLHTKAWSFLSFTHGLWLPGLVSQNVYIHTCMYIYTCMYSMLEVLTLMAFWKTHIDVNWQTAQNLTTSQKTEIFNCWQKPYSTSGIQRKAASSIQMQIQLLQVSIDVTGSRIASLV